MTPITDASLADIEASIELEADHENHFCFDPDTTRSIIARLRAAEAAAAGIPGFGEVWTSLVAERDALRAEIDKATDYARSFISSFVEKNFPENKGWKPLDGLLGLLTQIDNAVCIVDTLRAENERLIADVAALRDTMATREKHEYLVDCVSYSLKWLRDSAAVEAERAACEGIARATARQRIAASKASSNPSIDEWMAVTAEQIADAIAARRKA